MLKKKCTSSKTIIGRSVKSSWSGHFLYSLQPHLEFGNIDLGFACCWLWFRHCWDLYVQLQKKKRQKIHQTNKMTVTMQTLYSICVCTKPKTSGKTHSTLAYTQCMPIHTVYAHTHTHSELHEIISSSQACISDVQAWMHHNKQDRNESHHFKTFRKTKFHPLPSKWLVVTYLCLPLSST